MDEYDPLQHLSDERRADLIKKAEKSLDRYKYSIHDVSAGYDVPRYTRMGIYEVKQSLHKK